MYSQGCFDKEATKKNLLRKILSQFDNLKTLTYKHNKVLIFLSTFQVEDLLVSNYDIHQELTSLKSEIETDVIKAARLLNKKIKNYPFQMSWPPKAEELHPSKTKIIHSTSSGYILYCASFWKISTERMLLAKLKEYWDWKILFQRHGFCRIY